MKIKNVCHKDSCSHHFSASAPTKQTPLSLGFTLVEMLMALLIVSVILSASLPVISQRQKAMASNYNQNRSFPIGGVILWTDMNKLPDNTWMECNGMAIPNGVEYEQARRVFGTNLPDLRNNSMEYINNLNTYLSNDIKNYLQNAIKPIPKNLIGIWGSSDTIPDGWTWDRSYDGVFLRGWGSVASSHYGNVHHKSAAIGTLQGDAIRNLNGHFRNVSINGNTNVASLSGVFMKEEQHPSGGYGAPSSWSSWGTLNILFNASLVTPTDNEIRPINKAVRYIKYTNAPALPDIPDPPQSKIYYRYIAKVRY